MRRGTTTLALLASALPLVAAFGPGGNPAARPGGPTELAAPQSQHGPSSASQVFPLYSHGGAVVVNPAIYISWWGGEWVQGFETGSYSSAQAQTYIGDFFGGVGGTGWANVVTQYCENVPKGTEDCSTVPGAVTITNPPGQLKGQWDDARRPCPPPLTRATSPSGNGIVGWPHRGRVELAGPTRGRRC